MALTLQDLKTAMAPLAEIGKGELTFEVSGTLITLRALTPDEEIQVQRHARSILADGDLTDQANALEYLDRFRIASLGYSIVHIGALDFRDVEFVETGEKLPNGVAIKVKRHEAIQQLVGTWSRNMAVAVFKKFGELMNDVEKEVDGLIVFDPIDYDGEISRLEERVRELHEEKARAKASEDDLRTNLRNQVASSGKSFRKPNGESTAQTEDSLQDQTSTRQEADSVTVPSDVDREVISEDGTPPESPDVQPTAPAGPRAPVFARSGARVPPPAPTAEIASRAQPQDPEVGNDPLSGVMSSMVDMNDPDMAEKAVEAETRRLIEMRSAGRQPPHQKAKQVAQEMAKQEVEHPVAAGTKNGVEVYKMPTQTLTDRRPPEGPPAAPVKSNVNPRFKPTRSGG
jgi:hypothetical protein